MTDEEMKKLKQTIEYFGHWYDVIGEERIAILEKVVVELTEKDKQIEALQESYANSEMNLKHTTDLLEEKDKQIEELKKDIEIIKADRNRRLEKMSIGFQNKQKELEAQIEKMKCCKICEFSNGCGVCLSNNVCKNHSEWKLKE